DVGVDRRLAGELAADLFARLVDALALHHAVGAGEINVLEYAEPPRHRLERFQAAQAAGADDDDLAGLDVAHELGPDDVEPASLRRQDPRVAEAADHQRPHAERVAQPDQRLLRQR